MSDFTIRETGTVAQNWKTNLQEAKPGLFDKNRVTTDTRLTRCEESFTNFYHTNLALLSENVLPKDLEKFAQKGMDKFNEILHETFSQVVTGTTPKKEFHKLLMEANTRAREALKDLGSEFFAGKKGWETDVEESMTRGKDNVRVKTDDFGRAQGHLSSYLKTSTNELRRVQKDDKQGAFDQAVNKINARLEAKFEELKGGVIARSTKDGVVQQNDFRDVIRTMQVEAQRELLKLYNDFPASPRPQVFVDSEGKVNLVRKAPALENLVLQGGGAKGVGTPPHIRELARTGMLDGIKQVVGTSAGALTAALMSSGMSVDDMQKLMDDTPLTDLQGTIEGFDTIYPGYGLENSGGGGDRLLLGLKTGSKDHPAQKALQLLDQNTTKSVHEFVKDNHAMIQQAVNDNKITQDQANRLIDTFTDEPDYTQDRSGKMVTFNDLDILHKVKPDQFKQLTLTGWNRTDDKVDYFKAGGPFGDMPVAFAGRISMSIPIYFQNVQYGGKEYHDGGLGSNLPSETVTEGLDGNELGEARAKTMLMIFDDQDKGFTTLFKSGNLGETPPDPKIDIAHNIMNRTTGADFAGNKVKDLVKAYESGPNVQVIFHGKVDTFDLDVTERNKSFAKITATLMALQQIEAKQQEGYHVTVDDVNGAMNLLSEDEKRAIREGGEPTQKEYPRDQDLRIARSLYQRCVGEQEERLEIARLNEIDVGGENA